MFQMKNDSKKLLLVNEQRKTELELLKQENADMMLYVAEVEQKTQQDNADLLLSLAEAGVL
ncbi:hypothetical protein HCA15_16020 [Listeria booriae]|nr:hypothetical protein [Listeria booriae]